jgi:hypothetical protein
VALQGRFIYWGVSREHSGSIGRARMNGSAAEPSFITGLWSRTCGVATDSLP